MLTVSSPQVVSLVSIINFVSPPYKDYVVVRQLRFGMRLIHSDPASITFYLCDSERDF